MLTDKQKSIVRTMILNTSTENMERVAKLSDEEVIAEIEIFKASRLEFLAANHTRVSLDLQYVVNELEKINKEIEGWG